ncbi:hypothetical protein N9L47_03435 [Rhodobacteraceae bacterium]|nr:hypothetical protein [Paracoccaceae bacterium]
MNDDNLGDFARPITTSSKNAQASFNRGLVWCYAYFHEEAIDCFKKAVEADLACAMAYWGIAYAAGPNYNLPWKRHDRTMQKDAMATCFDAVQSALGNLDNATPAERALIEALATRFPQREPADLKVMNNWNVDFVTAMETIQKAYPNDLDIRTVLVEAIMNLTPWAMWDQTTGEPAEGAGTKAAQALLEEAMDADPAAMRHPGILHLYVHLMEMSQTPELALKAGDVLRDLVPDAGHLIHMPTHIDIQCGHYQNVYAWNRKAIIADRKAREKHGDFNIYTGYRIHNYHFAAYGAMFLGQFKPAWTAARELVDNLPEDLLRITSPPFADFYESYLSVWVHVLIRFGRWQQIIDEPLPQDANLYAYLTATLHYAKGVAYAATGDVTKADAARADFQTARDAVPDTRRMHNVRCSAQLEVATAMLDGEIEYRKANYDLAFAHLREAVALEDALPYDEPWGWMQPTRHALGALLLEQGHVDDAEATYREDLGLGGTLTRAQVHPDNVWSLRGLNDCLKAQGFSDTPEARLIAQRLALAEARADKRVGASCFCAAAAV